jgi:23S rRNA (adenine2503-C2)-methyltransferase
LSITLDLSRASTPSSKAPVNLAGLTRAGLRDALVEGGVCDAGKAKMRATQIFRWIHHRGVTDFAAMTDVAKETRARLAGFTLPARDRRAPGVQGRHPQVADPHGPGHRGRGVYIPDVGRAGALCVSSARSAARSTAASATPAPRSWSAT